MISYDILPFDPSPERAEIVSSIIRSLATHETFFSGYAGSCEEDCITSGTTLVDMCERCTMKMRAVSHLLMKADSRVWEVWKTTDASEVEPIGVVMFTSITPGLDAFGHYVFFDGKLSDKTEILEDIIQWGFLDHPEEGWVKLKRYTVEIPLPFAALARHASRKLGFTGPFRYNLNEKTQLKIEGIKKGGASWRGSMHDMLVLGRLAPQTTPNEV